MTRAAKPSSQPARRQSPKSGPGRTGTADRSASSHQAEKTAGRAGSGDSERSTGRAVLSLGPEGLRLEPSDADSRLARLAALWAEYDGLTRRDWACNRAVDLRAEIRKVLDVKP